MRSTGDGETITAMAAAVLRFAVFGGPRVWRDGAELDLGPPQRRQLAVLLMLAGGAAVSSDLIVETLWEDEPPDTALNVVHRHVGQLRRTLEPELTSRQQGSFVIPAGNGYRLVVAADTLDLLELRALLVGGEAERDLLAVRRALELVAGRAGAAVTTTRGLEAMLAAVETDRIAAGLAAAAHVDASADAAEARVVLPGIQAIATDHPFDEPLQAALTRTLVHAGRRADALTHVGAVRALLDEQLGLTPGRELQAAQRMALLDPEADGPDAAEHPRPRRPPRPAQLPVHPARIVGRRAEHAVVLEQLGEPDAGSTLCVITGMGGIGKTALAHRCAQDLQDAYPDGLLYVNLHGYDSEVEPAPPGEVLRGFLVALGVGATELPAALDDRAALFRSIVADQQVLVVLDNAHDSAHVRPLLPGGRGCGVLVTSRRRLDELVAGGAFAVALERLDREDGVELLRSRLGATRVEQEAEAAERVVEACEGVPLALSVLAAQVGRYREVTLGQLLEQLAEPSGTLELLSGGAPANDLRRVLSWSYEALSAPAARMFRCTGIQPGPGLSLLTAASLAGTDVAGARHALDELARANLVTEIAPSRFQALQLLRAYAAGLLGEDEAIAARERLLGHYLGTLRNAYLLHGRPALCALPEPASGVAPESFESLGEAHAWYLRERESLAALVVLTAASGQAVESACLVLDSRPIAQHHAPAGDLLPLTRAALDAVERSGGPRCCGPSCSATSASCSVGPATVRRAGTPWSGRCPASPRWRTRPARAAPCGTSRARPASTATSTPPWATPRPASRWRAGSRTRPRRRCSSRRWPRR